MTARLQPVARVLCVLALVTLATTVASGKLGRPATGIDDANIFFVYARNVSAGEGFVFNPAGERVEGFTSLLWVFICTAAVSIVESPERVLLCFNVLLLSLTIACCLRGLRAAWAVAFLILLFSDVPYVVWNTLTLMETALWGALVTVAALASAEERFSRNDGVLVAVLAALLVLTRPEALLWVPVLLVLFYLTRAGASSRGSALALVVPAAVVFLATAALITIFRLVYFGYPLPNTYYAKVSPSLIYRFQEGRGYLMSYIVSSPIVFAGVLAIAISAAHSMRVRFGDKRTLALTVIAATGLVMPVLTGGDHFGGFRFYQPVYPLLLLNLLNCMRVVIPQYLPIPIESAVTHRLKLGGAALAFGICVVLQTVAWIAVDRTDMLGREFDIATAGRRTGERANAVFGEVNPRPGIATITVGGMKYAYEGHVIDLMGLNNTRMAHNGGDRIGFRSHAAFEVRTFYELKPEILLPLVQDSDGLATAERRDPFARKVLKGLLEEPEFRNRYQLAEVRKATSSGIAAFAAWYEHAFLARLTREGFQVVVADAE